MNTVTLDELMDADSDFHVTRHADAAHRFARLAAIALGNGQDGMAALMARKAAHEGIAALAIIERRGSDDLEMFIGE